MGLLNDDVLGQVLGDESFPIEWASEEEKRLFWVYDDLHCPKPLSPMYEDIGGWWLSCDHMFRRFGTPFASDWIYKNINGYLYTAAIPAEAGLKFDTQEYNYRTNPIVPEVGDEDYAEKIGAYLGATLGVYGQNFAYWWKTRFVPEMQKNFDYIESMLEQKDELTPGRSGGPPRGRHRHARSPLEDPLDAQLRAAERDAQPARGHGRDARRRR